MRLRDFVGSMGQLFGKQSPHMEKTSVPYPGASQPSEKVDDDNEVFGFALLSMYVVVDHTALLICSALFIAVFPCFGVTILRTVHRFYKMGQLEFSILALKSSAFGFVLLQVYHGQGEADACLNNGRPTKGTAATDSTGAGNAGSRASAADPNSSRPHLVRLFSRDAPGRQDNTFKDRPSESDELHTIPECAVDPAVQDRD